MSVGVSSNTDQKKFALRSFSSGRGAAICVANGMLKMLEHWHHYYQRLSSAITESSFVVVSRHSCCVVFIRRIYSRTRFCSATKIAPCIVLFRYTCRGTSYRLVSFRIYSYTNRSGVLNCGSRRDFGDSVPIRVGSYSCRGQLGSSRMFIVRVIGVGGGGGCARSFTYRRDSY